MCGSTARRWAARCTSPTWVSPALELHVTLKHLHGALRKHSAPDVRDVSGSADPAAESFDYPVAFDLRDLVSLDDVMEELQLGPNGCVTAAVPPLQASVAAQRPLPEAPHLLCAGACSTAWSTWRRTSTSGLARSSRCVLACQRGVLGAWHREASRMPARTASARARAPAPG